MNVSFLREDPPPLLQSLWEPSRDVLQEALLFPYLPASLAFLAHVLFSAPFLALDSLARVSPRIRSWRMSAGSGPPPSLRRWGDCFWRILLRYLTAVLPASTLLQGLRGPSSPPPRLAPGVWQLFVEVFACFLVFDALFFVWHFFMHRFPWLYRNIHSMHHKHKVPIALAAQDASALELISLLLLAQVSALVVGCHPMSEIVFHLLNSWLAVEDHCGYDLPLALNRLLPFFGGAPYHQAHHALHTRNYAPYFIHWDLLFGTYFFQE